jgi:hypothetical protein
MTHKLASLGPTAVWQYVPSLTWKKTITRRLTAARVHGLVLATLLLGLVIATPMASAGEWTDHSGTICKNYNASEVGYIDYFAYGTRSLSPSYTYVICPLTRNTTGTNGAYVFVYVTGSLPTSCGAYSYDYYGGLLVSNSVSGTGLLGIPLAGSGYSTAYSYYSVLCYLPGNGASVLTSVDIYEY